MVPLNLSMSNSASSSAKGGEFGGGGTNAFTGDWTVNTAGNGGASGFNIDTQTLILIGIAGLVLWKLTHKK